MYHEIQAALESSYDPSNKPQVHGPYGVCFYPQEAKLHAKCQERDLWIAPVRHRQTYAPDSHKDFDTVEISGAHVTLVCSKNPQDRLSCRQNECLPGAKLSVLEAYAYETPRGRVLYRADSMESKGHHWLPPRTMPQSAVRTELFVYARVLLRYNELDNDAVAAAGYADLKDFHRTFRERYGPHYAERNRFVHVCVVR